MYTFILGVAVGVIAEFIALSIMAIWYDEKEKRILEEKNNVQI